MQKMSEKEAVETLKTMHPKKCKIVDGRLKGGFDNHECKEEQAIDMVSIENEMKKLYPFWNSLSKNEKTIVSDIASQIPMNCESVATIFLIHGASDRNLTIDYIKTQYGFVVN